MKLNDIIKIDSTLMNIETLLLDFEQFPQTTVLYSVLSNLQIVSQKFRKYFQLKYINCLINELIISISAAIEKEIVLEIADIDLFLSIKDLFLHSCNITYKNISDIANITDDISIEYLNSIKKTNKTISLIKKTKYLKNELLTEYNDKKATKKEQSEHKQISIVSKNEKIQQKKTDELKIDSIGQKIQLTDLSELVLLFNRTLDIAKESNIALTEKEKDSISNIKLYIDTNSNSNILETLEASEKQLDFIDDYIGSLKKFSVKKEKEKEKNEIILNKYINYNEIENLLKKTISLTKIFNYNEDIRSDIKEIIEYLADVENIAKKNPNKKITEHLSKIRVLLNNFGDKINDKFLDASVGTNSIYNQISELRCKPFSSFTFGLKDYTKAVAESVNKNINLKIDGNNTDVTADLWKVINNFLPTIIRHIILFNFSTNGDDNNIKIEFTSQYGIAELKIYDNGKKNDTKILHKMLYDVFLMCKNAGGRIFLTSGNKNNIIKIKFQLENILNNYIIFEVNKQYYAIPTEFYTVLDNTFNNDSSIKTISLYSLFDIKNKNDKIENDFVTIKFSSKFIKILTDKVIGITMLSPKRLTNILYEMKHIIGVSQLGDKGVLLLDVEDIFSTIK